jgi:hypothetical protein
MRVFSMPKVRAYYGKHISTSAHVLKMALQEKGINFIPYINCITTEVFTRVCHIDTPAQWIIPYPNGFECLKTGMDSLGLNSNFESIELTGKTYDEFMLCMREEAKKGSFILGPLDPTSIWDRIESRYHKGMDRFIFVIKNISDNTFIVHDPEGCPYFHIDADMIYKGLKSSFGEYGIFRVDSFSKLNSDESIYKKIVFNVIKNRIEALNQRYCANKGLKQIAVMLSERRLKSSEAAALTFSGAETGLALFYAIEFLSNPPVEIFNNEYFKRSIIKKLINILNEYKNTVAKLLFNIKQADYPAINLCLINMAEFEHELDCCFLELNKWKLSNIDL